MQSTAETTFLPPGIRAAGVHSGIRPRGALDLGILIADRTGHARVRFTQNALLGAHIPICREHLAASHGRVRAVIVNSGNANCATGEAGLRDARRLCRAVAGAIDCPPTEVLCMSTGVIGAHLPIDRMLERVPELCARATTERTVEFAHAILTTDTVPKFAHALAGDSGQVSGIAKGAGMIHPQLATMLAFLCTDVPLSNLSDSGMSRVVDSTFHRLTIDGDTSPNDTVLIWSSAPGQIGSSDDEDQARDGQLERALVEVGTSLCRQIAADGEGASRTVTIEVRGAATEADAARVGRAIGTSMLVKTAVTGRDPNWGRILSAAGQVVAFSSEHARVWIGDADLFSHGCPRPENELAAHEHLRNQQDVRIGIDLAVGSATADVWTCDLTKDYVTINSDYRS